MFFIDKITTLQVTSVFCIGVGILFFLTYRQELILGLLGTTNIVLLRRLATEIPVTLINKLILLDCTVALLNIPIILNIGYVYRFPCAFIK